MFEPGTLLLLLLLGGVVAVDGTSFGQFMISRPFVSAALGGLVLGQPAAGAMIGLILEAFHLAVLPVGAARYPEGGPPALAAGAVFASGAQLPSVLVLLVLGTLIMEWAGGESVRLLRQSTVRMVLDGGRGIAQAGRLERRHVGAILLDFGRGAGLTAATLILLQLIVVLLAPRWALSQRVAEIVLMAAVAGLLASTFRMVGSRTWFAMAGALTAGVFLILLL